MDANKNAVKPEKFIQSYKCECFQPHNYCNCSEKVVGSELLVESVRDTAKAISEVMVICSVPEMNAKLSIDVVFYYFLHFQEPRTRIDAVPRKRLYRLDLLNDLTCKCDMSFMHAQISYSIIKRAFRAFYFGTDEGGVPNPFLLKQLKHTASCLWYHAARRTAQVLANYQGMFPIVQKHIELEIRQVYKKLYERLKALIPEADEEHECTCMKCFKRVMIESLHAARSATQLHAKRSQYERQFQHETKLAEVTYWGSQLTEEREIEAEELCSCPNLNRRKDEYPIPFLAEATNTGYSQGPFECYWFPISENSDKEDDVVPDIQLPEEYPCPPCVEEEEIDESCGSSCECICESCSCESEELCDRESDTVITTEIIEEEELLEESEEKDAPFQMGAKLPSIKYDGCHVPIEVFSSSELESIKSAPKNNKSRRRTKMKSSGAMHIPQVNGSVLRQRSVAMEEVRLSKAKLDDIKAKSSTLQFFPPSSLSSSDKETDPLQRKAKEITPKSVKGVEGILKKSKSSVSYKNQGNDEEVEQAQAAVKDILKNIF